VKPVVLLDTGPLVAFLNRREEHHRWVRNEFAQLRPPLLTCEAVLTEACWLLRDIPGGPEAALELVTREIVTIPFRLEREVAMIGKAMARYGNLPMSMADACLVKMAEVHAPAEVLTLDAHFRIYRLPSRRSIPVRMPNPTSIKS
jgi:predicted nucleic acid-binding protein